MIQIGTIKETKAILDKYNLHAKKKFGQNFLVDPNILDRIVESAEVDDSDTVIEIGPGIGALTQRILESAKNVIAYEIDPQMVEILNDNFQGAENLEIIHKDFLKADLQSWKKIEKIKMVANLPYYITTPILFHILESEVAFQSITTMMQKEVGERLTANVGTKDYGALTLMIEYFCDVQMKLKVPNTVFYPSPNVDSVVMQLTPKKNFEKFKYQAELFKLIDASFVMRRKTLINNLQTYFGKDNVDKEKLLTSFEKINIEPSVRAERLTLDDFKLLTEQLIAEGFSFY